MRRIVIATVFVIGLSGLSWADFQDGLDALDEGDFAAALGELRPLAKKGHARAQHELGILHATGKGVPRSYSKAAEWFRQAADQGHAPSQKFLGDMYRRGRGAEKNFKTAAKWYRRAAEEGHALAQKNLGDMYRKGFGVPKDKKKALKWYRASAKQGEPWGQLSLGRLYEQGRGVGKDFAEAAKWFRKAADQGNAKAKFKLGQMYEKGRGVEEDIVQAAALYAAALAQGLEAAQKALRRLDRQTAHNSKPVERIHKGIILTAIPARPGLKVASGQTKSGDALDNIRKSLDIVIKKSPVSAAAIKTLMKKGKVHVVYDPAWEPPYAGRSTSAEFDPSYFNEGEGGNDGRDFVMVVGPQAINLPPDEFSAILVHFLVGQGMLHLNGFSELVREKDLKCAAFLYQEQFYQDIGVKKGSRKLISFRTALEGIFCAKFKKYMRKNVASKTKMWDVRDPDVPKLLKIFGEYAQKVHQR